MATLTIELPDAVIAESGLTRDAFEREARFVLAAKLYELGRLPSGAAAELCGLPRADFLASLGRVDVAAIQLDPREFEREFAGF